MTEDRPLDQTASFRHWTEDRVRFADLDPLGHCNNAAISGFFETSRVELLDDVGLHMGKSPYITPLVHASIDYRHELFYGTPVRIGVRVAALGRTSFTLEAGVFTGTDACAATGRFILVLLETASRSKLPLPEDIRDRMMAYA